MLQVLIEQLRMGHECQSSDFLWRFPCSSRGWDSPFYFPILHHWCVAQWGNNTGNSNLCRCIALACRPVMLTAHSWAHWLTTLASHQAEQDASTINGVSISGAGRLMVCEHTLTQCRPLEFYHSYFCSPGQPCTLTCDCQQSPWCPHTIYHSVFSLNASFSYITVDPLIDGILAFKMSTYNILRYTW